MLGKQKVVRNPSKVGIQRALPSIKPKRGDINNSQLGGFYYNPVVICITGYKGSGKTLVAKMLSYMISVNNTRKGFRDFAAFIEDKHLAIQLSRTIINFGDFVKHSINNLIGVPVDVMNDTYLKEDVAVRIIDGMLMSVSGELSGEFEKYEVVNDSNVIYELDDLAKHGFVPICPDTKKLVAIRIRTLMQYHGDTMKKCYGKRVFAKRGRIKIKNIVTKYGYAIVGDCRYQEEIDACRDITPKMYVINVNRDAAKPIGKPEHSSEENNLKSTHVIDNNGSLLLLYYKVEELLHKIKNENRKYIDDNTIKRF